jgi:hypothetical protein
MVLLRDYLRGHIRGRAAKGVNTCWWLGLDAEAKIDEFHVFVPIEQDVLGLDIPVDDVFLMQVG